MKRTITLILLVMLFIVGSLFAVPAAAETAVVANDTEPTLLYKTNPSNSAKPLSTYSPSLGSISTIYLYYGTISGEQTALTAGTLTSSDTDSLAVSKSNDGIRYTLSTKQIGTTTLTYTDNGITYTTQITITLPSKGLYTSQTRAEKYYLSSVYYYGLDNKTVWFLTTNGYTQEESAGISIKIMYNDVELPSSSYEWKSRGGDMYDLKITLPALPAKRASYQLHIYQNGKQIFSRSVSGILKVDTPYIDGEHSYTYTVSENEAEITGCSGTGGYIVFPSTITDENGTYTVTAIGDNASMPRDVLSVVIPNTVTQIGESVFKNCGYLGSVTIPSSVKSIGSQAFSYCHSLTEIVLPEGLESLGGKTFYACRSLKKVKLPSTLVTLGSNEFTYNGEAMNESNLHTIGPIGSGCDIEYAWTTSIPQNAFNGLGSVHTITIAPGITSIGSGAFSNCQNLKEISLPNSVTSLDSNVFSNCTKLTSITIPASVTIMEDNCITNCANVTIYGYGNSAAKTYAQNNSLPFKALDGSGDLEGGGTQTPKPDTPIVPDAYSGSCGTNLTWQYDKETDTLTISGSGPMKDFGANNAPWRAFAPTATTLVLPEGLTVITQYAFNNFVKLTTLTLPDSVTTLEAQAFSGCTGLTKIRVPKALTTMKMNTFTGCTGITSAGPIGSGADFEYGWTTALPQYAFSGLTNLSSITFHKDVKQFGSFLFNMCSSLEQVVIPETVTTFKAGGGGCSFTGWPNAVTLGPVGDGSDYNIEFSWTKEIPAGAFSYINALREVTLPDSIEVIGQNAFAYGGFTTLNLPRALKVIGASAFNWCNKWDGEIYLPASLQEIGNTAFTFCESIDKVWIDKGAEKIGKLAFANCTDLHFVHIPGTLWDIGYGCFYNCPKLHRGIPHQTWADMYPDRYQPQTVSTFKTYALRRNTPQFNLAAASIEESTNGYIVFGWDETLPANAFNDTNSLTSIILPETLKEIGDGALSGCSALTAVNIPASVQKMGAGVFTGADNLTSAGPAGTAVNYSITFGWTETIPDNAFYGAASVANNIVIPKTVKSIGKGALDTDAIYLNGEDLTAKNMADGLNGKPVTVAKDAAEAEVLAAADAEINRLLAAHKDEFAYTVKLSEGKCDVEIWLLKTPGTKQTASLSIRNSQEEPPKPEIPKEPDPILVAAAIELNGKQVNVKAGASSAAITDAVEALILPIISQAEITYSIQLNGSICLVSLTMDGMTQTATIYIEEQQPQSTTDWGMVLILQQLYNRTFTFPVIASEGGSVTHDAEDGIIKYGRNVTYTFTPDEGYTIADVLIDGKSVGAVSEYTFKKVRRAHDIVVIFNPIEESLNMEAAE